MTTTELQHINPDLLICKFFDNEASDEEKRLLLQWLTLSEHNKFQFQQAQQLHIATRCSNAAQTLDSDKAFALFEQQIAPRLISLKKIFLYAACIVTLLGVCIGLFLVSRTDNSNNGTLYACNTIPQQQVQLPDGSTLILKQNAQALFSSSNTTTRSVTLEGQAFFDVVHNPQKPFIITVDELQIKVLGTSFIVQANPQSDSVIVNVQSGRVLMLSPTKSLILSANQTGLFRKSSKELLPFAAFNKNTVAWKTNVLYFNATPLREVAATLGNYFNKHIHVDGEVAQYPLTVQLDNPNLDSVLQLLQLTFNLKVGHSNTDIVLHDNRSPH